MAGYINGSDLLLTVAGKCIGHCSSHTLTFNAETSDRSVKPPSTAAKSAGLWKDKAVKSLSVSIKAEGIAYQGEAEGGISALLAAYKGAAPVEVKGFYRGKDAAPYLSGRFVITSLEESSPAQDDVTYSVSLENCGEVTITDTAHADKQAGG